MDFNLIVVTVVGFLWRVHVVWLAAVRKLDEEVTAQKVIRDKSAYNSLKRMHSLDVSTNFLDTERYATSTMLMNTLLQLWISFILPRGLNLVNLITFLQRKLPNNDQNYY